MAINYEYQAYTLIGMAGRFQDFFNGEAQYVSFQYKDKDGNIKTKTVPNITLMKKQLNDHGITSDDLTAKLDSFGKIGDNLVFDYGQPDASVFDGKDNVIYVDKNTATLYTKNDGGSIVNNYNAKELETTLLDYMMINRDVVFGDGAPGTDTDKNVKLYIDSTSNTLYIQNDQGVLNSVSSTSQTEMPDITGPNNILETDEAIFTINNFDASRYTSYNITATAGNISRSNDKIHYTPANVDGDQNVTITVVATDANLLSASPVKITLGVTNVPEEADQVLVNNNYSGNEATNDGWAY